MRYAYRKWGQHALETVLAVVVLGGFVYGMYAGSDRTTRNASQEQASDDTLTRQRLDDFYPSLDGPNAAECFALAFGALNKSGSHAGMEGLILADMPVAVDVLTAEFAGQLERYLEQRAEAMGWLERATQMDACRFEPVLETYGELTLTGHHRDMFRCVDLLYLSAVSEADRGDLSAACERVAQLARVADVFYLEPVIISTLHSYRVRELASTLAEKLAATDGLSPDDLSLLEKALDPEPCRVPRWHYELSGASPNTDALYKRAGRCRARTDKVRQIVIDEIGQSKDDRLAALAG